MLYSESGPRRNLSVNGLKKALEGVVELRLNGWEVMGDLMVIELDDGYSSSEKKLIAEKIVELHPKAATVINRISIEDEFREPTVEVLAGESTETVYKENGCLFRLDPGKVMFSFGNKDERKRMAMISSEDETVVDMFSCVGQFAIPLAKHSRPRKVYAIEKNPAAFSYLQENVKLNKLDNVEAVAGDCTEVCPAGVADRVVMGYIFRPERFMETALNALKKDGTIHYHFISREKELGSVKSAAADIVKENSYEIISSHARKVKSYAPHVYHWVMDLVVSDAG